MGVRRGIFAYLVNSLLLIHGAASRASRLAVMVVDQPVVAVGRYGLGVESWSFGVPSEG